MHRRLNKILLTVAILMLPALKCEAESRYSLEAGGASMTDTYLSPLRYNGTCLSLGGYWQRFPGSFPGGVSMEGDAVISGAVAGSPSGNSHLYSLMIRGGWGMSYHFALPWQLEMSTGAGIGVETGVLYLPFNGNNPASAKAYAGLHLRATLSRRLTLFKRRARVRTEVTLPSIGAMFSPEYGEAYYEIYLGNHRNLVHAAWWGNRMRLMAGLSLDMTLGRHTLTLGYGYGLTSTKVCGLNTRIITNSLTIGIIPGKL